MKLFKFKEDKLKEEIYHDLKKANDDLRFSEQELARKQEKLSRTLEENCYFSDNLENVYSTLKTIKSLTKDKTIETICVLKMQDLENMSGISISGDE